MVQHVEKLKQRADYTQKFNAVSGRHGWLRLTPAYSPKIVEEILAREPRVERILDPFCGTGTTALSAIERGCDAVTTDINPFLVWFTMAKTRHYSPEEVEETLASLEDVLALVESAECRAEPPPIHQIERWWGPSNVDFLCRLRCAIDLASEEGASNDLLKVAFCRTLIKLSNAAFNHQSMSFKSSDPMLDLNIDCAAIFRADCEQVCQGATANSKGVSHVYMYDARELSQAFLGTFDMVITSPPYANRMSYIRELRPYMYWLGYLVEAREAGEMDWKAIGGTWGIATSRLNDWQSRYRFTHPHLSDVSSAMRARTNKNGELLASYVGKYFDDIFEHFMSLQSVVRPGGRVHYIVGNSTFYGTVLNTQQIYADIMRANGFQEVQIRAIRKRNSKKDLFEYVVSATAGE